MSATDAVCFCNILTQKRISALEQNAEDSNFTAENFVFTFKYFLTRIFFIFIERKTQTALMLTKLCLNISVGT